MEQENARKGTTSVFAFDGPPTGSQAVPFKRQRRDRLLACCGPHFRRILDANPCAERDHDEERAFDDGS
jgi:hypothetical protein